MTKGRAEVDFPAKGFPAKDKPKRDRLEVELDNIKSQRASIAAG